MPAWPPPHETLVALIRGQESALLEKKQQWYDLADQRGKGTLIKHLLALANSTRPDAAGYLVFGVEDDRHGGAVVGLDEPPDEAQLAQALRRYTQPVPEVLAHTWREDGKLLTVLGVLHTDNWPYYASRDVEGTLSSELVYHRVGPTVSVMKPSQLEKAIREKAARVGSALPSESLLVGFIERGNWHGPTGPILRLTNLAGESLRDIVVSFDLAAPYDPQIFVRQSSLNGATLGAGQSRDVECRLHASLFNVRLGDRVFGDSVRDRWIDVTAHVLYRDELGFLRTLTAVCRLD